MMADSGAAATFDIGLDLPDTAVGALDSNSVGLSNGPGGGGPHPGG